MGGYEGEPDIFSSNNGGSTKFVETKKLGMRGGGGIRKQKLLASQSQNDSQSSRKPFDQSRTKLVNLSRPTLLVIPDRSVAVKIYPFYINFNTLVYFLS